MVQEKNAAKNAVDEFNEWLRKENERMDKEVIDSRFYVVEHTPEYDYGDGWSRPIPAKTVRVSEYFDSIEEAREWKDRHVPDKGNELQIRKDNKRRIVTEQWYPY